MELNLENGADIWCRDPNSCWLYFYNIYSDAPADQFVVGNKATEFIYATEGVLGYKPFFKDLYEDPTFIELNIDNIRSAIALVMVSEIRDRLEKRREVTERDVNSLRDVRFVKPKRGRSVPIKLGVCAVFHYPNCW